MSRPPRHPLNRFAQVAEYQVSSVRPLANVFVNPMANAEKHVYASIYLRWLVSHGLKHFPLNCFDERTVERHSWLVALERELQSLKHRSPRATSEQAYDLATQLHEYPDICRLESPIIRAAKRYPKLTFAHFLKISSLGIRPITAYDDPADLFTSAVNCASNEGWQSAFPKELPRIRRTQKKCNANSRRLNHWARVASEKNWSPKKLETEIKAHRKKDVTARRARRQE